MAELITSALCCKKIDTDEGKVMSKQTNNKKMELNGLNLPLNDYPSKIPVKLSLEQASEIYTLDVFLYFAL